MATMPDALTESFCERCGTRYEFAAPPRVTPLHRTRGLMSGLKNYILSQDSLSDALGDAMRSQAEGLAAKQLEAFHESFNFCIDCRQYTCTNCWNEAAGRCQSCQPLTDAEAMAKRFATTLGTVPPDFGVSFESATGTSGEQSREGVAWPAADVIEPEPEPTPLLTWLQPDAAPEPLVSEPEPEPVIVEAEAEPEPVVVEAEAEPEPVVVEAEAEPETVVVEPEPEPIVVDAEVEPEPEPVPFVTWLHPEVEPEPVAEPEPEVVVAEAELEPELVEAEAEATVEPDPEPEPYRPLRPVTDTFMHYPRAVPVSEEQVAAEADLAAAAEIDAETLAARRAQLDLLGLGDPGQGPVGPARPVVLPYRSGGAATRDGARLAAVAAAAGGAFWDASAREVAGAITEIGVRSCGHCELSLSATARFCRRCGTPQSQSA